MIKSFFKIALRYLWRKKTYSLLNFGCLTFGLTCAIITVLYIMNILSYDRFHKNYNRLFAVDAYVTYFNGDRFPKEFLSASLADLLKENAPEIEETTRIAEKEYSFISSDNTFNETGFIADNNFFKTFTFPLIQSGSKDILNDPNSIAISERMAIKFFKTSDCEGRTIILKNGNAQESYKVSGVFRRVPRQSLMQFDFVIPFSRFLADNKWAGDPGATSNETWILLKENADRKEVTNKIKNLIIKQESTLNQELFLFPLKEQILYTYAGGKRVWKAMQNIVIIGAIGFSILLIACFNFINLAIALNFRRYREAGVKKVAGAGKSTIVIHFLGETFIITFISLLTAFFFTWLLLSGFNKMFNYDIHLRLLDIRMIIIFTVITLLTGFISGALPALYLASCDPISAMKGEKITGQSFSVFRQSLIVFQFVIPIALIICLMIIKRQDSYLRNYDCGVDKDKVLVLNNTANIQSHAGSFKSRLYTIPGIEAVSFTNCIPSRGTRVSSEVSWGGKDASEKLHFWCVSADFDYNKAVRVNMVEGRYFDSSFPTDSTAYLINDVSAAVMKNKNPVGSEITVDGRKGVIIGVFKDFHAIDLAGPIVPTIMSIQNGIPPDILVKFSSVSYQSVNSELKAIFQQYEKETPFKAILFGDLTPYSDLSLPSKLVGLAFVIAILLACLGLFGLASFTSEQRTKEIGIRKANGATTSSVMLMLLSSYTGWLTIAVIIALPIAFLAGRIFLGRFHFHSPMPFMAFLLGPVLASVVAILTVSSQTWSVANRNPVQALRYE